MAVKLKCPECRIKFPWDIVKNGFPEFCPNPECSTRIACDRADDDIVMPSIRSMKTKVTDAVYRQMEQASEHRAEQAAMQAGVPVADMSELKITNLQSATRQGDIAAPPVNNSVTQFMNANPQAAVGFQSNGAGAEYSSAVMSGSHPNMGAKTRSAIHAHHANMVPQVCIGKDERGNTVRASPFGAVSDMPARETQQPGYIRRG